MAAQTRAQAAEDTDDKVSIVAVDPDTTAPQASRGSSLSADASIFDDEREENDMLDIVQRGVDEVLDDILDGHCAE